MPLGVLGPTSHTYFAQRLRLHYVDWGNETAPALVLVHGGRDHCRSWDWVAQALRDSFHIVAPDLRGHGDSQWLIGSGYALVDYVYDLAQLIDQERLAPVAIIGHSLGGAIGLQYAGAYPEKVRKLIAIEGLGPAPNRIAQRAREPAHERMRSWIAMLRGMAGRTPRRYDTIEAAIARMREANPRLSAEQARHLTVHGTNQNEDGTHSWKFDNYSRGFSPYLFNEEEARALWRRITCPTLLIRGQESGVHGRDPDGPARDFPSARVVTVDGAGHWSHHDQLTAFLQMASDFLAE